MNSMPRITLRRVIVLTSLLLVANCLVLWSAAQRRWAEQQAVFEQKLNVSYPRMLYIHTDLMCDGAALSPLPAAKATTLHTRTPQCFIDQSKTYKFLSFALDLAKETSPAQERPMDEVCLSSQLSVDSLFWVTEQMKTWSGRLSLAVFTPGADYTIAMLMIRAMDTCDERLEDSVDFHFLYPVDMPPTLQEFDEFTYNCSTLEDYNKNLVKTVRTSSFKTTIARTKYPQNLLRNVARDRCYSEYSFTPDIDMIGTPKMYEKLADFFHSRADRNCEKCAYILPTYEIVTGARNPVDKTDLLTYIREKRAQRFHVHVFSQNQANSDLSRWEEGAGNSASVGVMYNITTYAEYWEPVYIAKTSGLPPFEEDFVGYGFTRNSQVLEMEAGGYSWFMLDSPFLSHRGFQTTKGRSSYRRRQISDNSRKYKKFKAKTLQRFGLAPNDPRYGTKPKKKDKKKKKSHS